MSLCQDVYTADITTKRPSHVVMIMSIVSSIEAIMINLKLICLVSNAVYHKDDQIEFQEASNHANMPDDAENIYAEPFGHIAGSNVHNTALAPLDNVLRYQNLLGKKLESGEMI